MHGIDLRGFWVGIGVMAFASAPAMARRKAPEPEPEHRPPVIITQGEQRLISIPGLKRYSLGSGILHALPSPSGQKDSILLKATQPGVTDLWVWKKDGTSEHRPIEVRGWKKGMTPDLQRRLSELREVEIWVVGDPDKGRVGYLIQGTVTSEREARVISHLLDTYPEQIESQVSLSDSLYNSGEKGVRHWIEKSSRKEDLELVADPETKRLIVRGGLPDPKTRLAVIRSIHEVFPLVETEIDTMPDRNPTIHFKVFLLELRKNRTQALGIEYPGMIPAALRITNLGIQTALSIEATIHALETEGSARILSQPELVVRAPGEAELFAGGEIPIESKTVYSAHVDWRSYGLSLKLKVQGASGRRVRADVQTEVSHLDAKVSSDTIPSFQANRMRTQIDATFGKPLLLSGLLQEGVKREVKGLPFLKDIPVLGTLFGSKEFLEDRSELVAVLLPSRNVPEAPRSAIGMDRPIGAAPLPRNWISPEDEMLIRSSPNFPWNVFGEDADKSGSNSIPFDAIPSAVADEWEVAP